MADIEKMREIVEEYKYTEDPERRVILKEKLEKLRNWEHPRVTAKLNELKSRGIMDASGNLLVKY